MTSAQETKTIMDNRSKRGSFSDVGSVSSLADRQRSGNTGRGSLLHRTGSIDDIEESSPTSSRGVGIREMDGGSRGDGNGSGNHESKGTKDEHELIPAWSDLKTKAGKERKRLPLACIACRRKKIRCSGEKPACKHCLRSRIPCVYKVTTRKAAPRTDYMTMLDKRLKRMEERVIKIIPNTDPVKMASIGRAIVKPLGPQSAKSGSAKKRAAEEAFGNEVNNWASSAPKSDVNRHLAGAEHVENTLLSEGLEYLPSKEIQEHLAEVFFDCLYGQSYHILHKPSFMWKLKAGTVPPVLTLAVCALSARFSTHPQVSTEPAFLRGESWAKPARDIALRRYDEPSITVLTVLLILGLHEFGTCQGGRSWMLGGMAMRMAYALQLHRELDHDPLGRKKDKSSELSCTDREIRRRTMWACFLMDRFNSSGTERPMFANEESINVQLPIREAHFQMEIPGATEFLNGRIKNPTSADTGQISDPRENMGVAAYLIKIIALWGRVIKYLNLGGTHNDPHPFWHPKSQYADLKRQAEDYMESLPKRMRYSPETLENFAAQRLANQFLYMHIAYNQVVLFLHKFAIPTTPGGKVPPDMPNDFVSQAAKMAVDAASKISVLLNETTNHLVAAPFVGYCAFASSTVHIWGIFSKNAQLEASSKRNLAYNVKYLSVMKKHWGMLHYMAENLKGIYRQHADAALGGGASGKADTNTIFQYGDWFDKYPHGVSGADYEDPAVPAESETGNATSLTSKSDLQSVEDFFHTLSPPASSNQRKAPRKQSQMSGRAESTQAPNTNIKNIKNEPRSHAPHIQSHQQQLLGIPSQHVHHQQASGVLDPALQQPTYNPYNSSFSQQAQGYPVGLFPPNQPLSVHKLDRHFVFGAYAQDPSASGLYHTGNDVMSSQPHDASQNPNQTNQALNSMLWDQSVDFSLAGLNGGGHPGAFADAVGSAAWFMPFNLAPPDVGNPDGDIGGFTGSPTAGMGEGRVYGEIQDLGQ